MSKKSRLPFDSIAMLLQGGGALGAYQAGVYEALSEAGLEPDWLAGISIGAINAAIIAGNAPKDRISKLRSFWESMTLDDFRYTPPVFKHLLTRNDDEHQVLNLISTMRTLFYGIPGFFKPRMVSPWIQAHGSLEATSFCDTAALKTTLENLVDFDRLNSDGIRLTVGAVNITSGNFTDFDSKSIRIDPEHIMASGALPPGLPPVKIGKDYYWDGGLVSNTPLQWLREDWLSKDTLIFQVDLWSANGEFPQNMAEVYTRMKDIQYSSRTRADSARLREQHQLSYALASLYEKLPDDLKQIPEIKALQDYCDRNVYNIVHLIYHNKSYEGYSKDFEFSRLSMEAHWQAGFEDTMHTLEHPEVLQRPHNKQGISFYDFSRQGGKLRKEQPPKLVEKKKTNASNAA